LIDDTYRNNLEANQMTYGPLNNHVASGMPSSPGRQFMLLLTGIMALLLAACGGGSGSGGGGGGGGVAAAQCTLTQAEVDALTPDDVLPPECNFLDIPPVVGLFILGTETVGVDLKLYVNGVKRDGSPMTLLDFQQATVTVDGVTVTRPEDWDVAAASGDVLSLVTLADYSFSISTPDLIGMGDLYDFVLEEAPAGFEAETINFSSDPATREPVIEVKPDPPADHWTTNLAALKTANDYDALFPNENTPLYDAMGTGLLGPFDSIDPPGDGLGLVERNRPASLIMVQTDGIDNASLTMSEDALVSLMERCHTTAIMLGTFQADGEPAKILEGRATLERLAGTRGAFVNALNASFLEAAITPFAQSLGNLVVFTVKAHTNFANGEVKIEVDQLPASEMPPFDIDGSCQI
jgi:hypothetical protein